MGSAQSARGIQLGGPGSAARCVGIPSRDLRPGRAGPRRAHFLRGRCAATGSGSAWKGSGRRWHAAPAPRALQRPPARTSPLPGAVDSVPAAPSPCLPPGRWGDGAPSLPARLSTGADCPQCAPTAPRRPGRGPAHVFPRRQGSAAMSATHPTRLETRTKESNARASQRVTARNPVAQ